MRVTVIATVRNEETSIGHLLASFQAQTRPPDEIVITDGGSTDGTVRVMEEYVRQGLPLRVIRAPGANISQGRNRAIAAATGDIIACVDAGVRLVPEWLEELTKPFSVQTSEVSPRLRKSETTPDVVSGFFLPDADGVFETAMGATVLPQLSDVNPDHFLPSSRSVAFSRAAWQAAGGYPEWLDYCEDLVFDLALRRAGCRFAFAPKAVAYFRPRSSLRAFFVQYYRYARGDGKADLWRKRHAIRYATYIAAPLAFLLGLRYNVLLVGLVVAALAYLRRPYRRLWPHLGQWGLGEQLYAIALVPAIRFLGDIAKMAGYPVGVWWRLHHRHE
jgi:glycosyltransferase involved in cell wall biosynthesis